MASNDTSEPQEPVTEYDDNESYDAADEGTADSSPDEEAILYADQLQKLHDAGFRG